MKKLYSIFTILFMLFVGHDVLAQQIGDLKGIHFQAVAIDDQGKEIVGIDINGKPLYKKEIGVRFSILSGDSGPVLYQEEHTTLTDQHGLFSLVIGQGELTGAGQYATLMEIPWIDADQFLKVEIAIKNDGNYKLVSLQQFMAVPYSFYTDDIADNAITTAKILDEEVLAEDIAEEAVTTSEIKNETVVAEDIAAGAVTSEEVLDATIVNADIADKTINLKSKVTDTLGVQNGGTGLGIIDAGDLVIGSGTNKLDTLSVMDSVMVFSNKSGKTELFKLRPGLRTSIEVDEATKTVYIHAVAQGGGPETGGGSVSTGNIPAGGQQERNFPANVALGDIVLVTTDTDLQGLTMTAYVRQAGHVNVVLFNGTGSAINLGTVNFKIANFGQ